MAVFAAARAEGLRDESIETDEDAFAEKSEDDEEARTNADGTDGFGAVRQATDHHGVNDHHAHPADFGKDEGQGQMESGTEFAAEDGNESGHGEREEDYIGWGGIRNR